MINLTGQGRVGVFIAGFPKSGTTALCDALSRLDNFDFGETKEPNFFCRDIVD